MIDVCDLNMAVKPLVSIWCLTYNFAPYIGKALDSFLEQETDFPFEIVVHDDCSTDETVTILRRYQAEHPEKIRLLLEETNQRTKHLHRFLDKIRGDYVAICEGDDYWCDPHKLQRQLGFLRENLDYSMAFHACDIEQAGKIVDEKKPYEEERAVSTGAVIFGGGMFCPSASCVFKTEYLHNLPEYYFVADIADFPMQIYMASCGRVYYLPDKMCVYRRGHAGSWSSTIKTDWSRELAHWKTEMNWLEMFNRTTAYRYAFYVKAREIKYYMVLLRNYLRTHKG